MTPPLVLVVDDEPDLVELVTLTLSRMSSTTQSRRRRRDAPRSCSRRSTSTCASPTCACPTATASTSRLDAGRTARTCPCAVITAHGNVESAVRALKLGAFDFVSKPLDLGVLRSSSPGAQALAARRTAASTTRTGHAAHRQRAGDAAAARDDRARGAQPGAGAHLRRVRHGQGARRAPDPRDRPARAKARSCR